MTIPKEEKWDLSGIEEFFKNTTFPEGDITLNGMVIVNVNKFLNSHLTICKANNGKATYQPYFDRLMALKAIISG